MFYLALKMGWKEQSFLSLEIDCVLIISRSQAILVSIPVSLQLFFCYAEGDWKGMHEKMGRIAENELTNLF